MADPPIVPDTAPDEPAEAGPARPRPPRRRPRPPPAPAPVDMGRRRFFRAFAGELIQTAATMAGAAQALQQASADAASAILNPEGAAGLLGPAGDATVQTPSGPTGFRTPFREDGGVIYLIDQRRLPDALVEYPCRSAGEVAYAIREMIVRGAPAIGQVAAIGLAMAAEQQRDGLPYARKAIIRGSANALINARPTAVNLRWAVDRVDGQVRGGRRAQRRRQRDRGRACAPRPMRSCSRPRPTTAGWRASGWRSCRSPTAGRSGSSPTATPGRSPAASTARRSGSSRPRTTPAARCTSGSTRRGRTCRAPG